VQISPLVGQFAPGYPSWKNLFPVFGQRQRGPFGAAAGVRGGGGVFAVRVFGTTGGLPMIGTHAAPDPGPVPGTHF